MKDFGQSDDSVKAQGDMTAIGTIKLTSTV